MRKTTSLTLCLSLFAGAAIAADMTPRGLHPIGTQRQLFFDDDIVETMVNTKRRLNAAVKVTEDPIIKRDRPWEGPDTRLDWCFFDDAIQKWRMRYSTGTYRADGRNEKGEVIVRGEEAGARLTCEAFSDDGIHWEKPELGLVEFNGSKANNIVPESMTMAYFAEDTHDSDRSRRYKGFVRKGTPSTRGMTMEYYYSADCYHWIRAADNPVVDTGDHVGRWGPTRFIGWDPIRKVYAFLMENNAHMRSPFNRRSIGRSESPDLTHWSEAETIIVADDTDYPDTDFYACPATFYEGWCIGFLWNFSTTNTTHHPQFIFSRDGIHFNRSYKQPIITRGDNGDFDCVSLYAAAPEIHGDEVFCFYYGTNWRSPEQLIRLGDKATAGIGLAKLPLDGFVSLEGARVDPSYVTTRSFTFSGSGLYLNTQAALQQWGAWPCQVRVELLDARHVPIEGYTLDDADVITTTGINQRVSWKGRSDLSGLAGKPVRLRIKFTNAKLYAFQFK